MIRFACPGCEATYTVPDEKAGKTGKCPKCQAQFVIPTPEPQAATPPPKSEPTPPPLFGTDVEVEIAPCPGCQARLMVSNKDIGADVECPYCKAVYRAEMPGSKAGEGSRTRRPLPSEVEPERPSRRRREEVEDERPSRRRRDEDEADEDDRPSRRRDEDEDDYEERPRRRGGRRKEVAAALVAAPAILLIIVGSLGLVMGLLNIGSTVMNLNQPFGPAGGAAGARKVGEYAGAGVSLLWGIVVLLGGVKMKSLSGRGSAMTGAIVSMVPCNPCCLFGLPIGIWAVVVMSRDDVKRAFD